MLMLPETWPYFLNAVAGTLVLWLCCCTLMVQKAWVALERCHAKQQRYRRRTFHEVLFLACRGL